MRNFKFQISNFKFDMGFTLVEVMLTLMVATVVGVLLVSIFVSHSGLFYKQDSLVNVGLSLNDALQKISGFVREGSSVALSYPEAQPVYTTSSSTLVLKLPSIGSSGVVENVFDFVVVYKDENKPAILRLKLFPDAQSTREAQDEVLTNLLDTVEFTYMDRNNQIVSPPDASQIKASLTVMAKTGSVSSKRTASSVMMLRNKL